MKSIFLLSIFVLAFVFMFSGLVLSVAPNGAHNVTQVSSSSAPADSPDSNAAQAGNLTELTISGYSSTQSWQGYFGNVTGTIQLADGSNNVMYNWSLADPKGEVYASPSNAVGWATIACFNVTQDASTLDATYNIGSGDADSVNGTFGAKNHNEFYTNNIDFAADSCNSVQLYDSTGASVDGTFEEVLLTDGTSPVFASLLESGSVNGFDQKDHDFEMLVLEDGHGTDTSTTPYYFYVELQ